MHTVYIVSAAWLSIGLIVAMAFGKFARVGRCKE